MASDRITSLALSSLSRLIDDLPLWNDAANTLQNLRWPREGESNVSKQQRRKRKNIFMETDKRNGTVHYTVSIEWPDGERFRRRHPNLKLAEHRLDRIRGAVVSGTWKELRDELTET